MHRISAAAWLVLLIAFLPSAAWAAECGACGRTSCTDCDPRQPCEPACKATWEEIKTKKPAYSMRCEYACTRAYECFCTDPAECRCSPPCGDVIVKKRLFKAEGKETVEKVPKYEVEMLPAEPCDCGRCCGVCWWNPLSVLRYLLHHE